MKHFIYKTSHINGKFYIGRHSTNNIKDSYLGSGIWVKGIKDKSSLTKTILEYADSVDSLLNLELKYINENFDNPLCMNMVKSSFGIGKGYKSKVPVWNKGLKGWQTKEVSEAISAANKGNQYAKGNKLSEEQKQHCRDIKTGKNNPMYGKSNPHSIESILHIKEFWTTEERIKQSKRMLNIEKIQCPHCLKFINKVLYAQWHGEKCKFKKIN